MVLVTVLLVVVDMGVVAEIMKIVSHVNSMVLALIVLGVPTTKVQMTQVTTLRLPVLLPHQEGMDAWLMAVVEVVPLVVVTPHLVPVLVQLVASSLVPIVAQLL